MRSPARRILETPQSATIRIADLAATLRREGVDVLDFSAGRASEDSPLDICQVAADALMGGDTHQTMARGTPEFRQACALKLERENGVVCDPEREIVATMGCKHGLMLALLATVNPGDEVIVLSPFFVEYVHYVANFEGKTVFVETDESSPPSTCNGSTWTEQCGTREREASRRR